MPGPAVLIPFQPWADITSVLPYGASNNYVTIDGAFAYAAGHSPSILLDIAETPYTGPGAQINLPMPMGTNNADLNNLNCCIVFDKRQQLFSVLLPQGSNYAQFYLCNRAGGNLQILNTPIGYHSQVAHYCYCYGGKFYYFDWGQYSDSLTFYNTMGQVVSNWPSLYLGNFDGAIGIDGALLYMNDWNGTSPRMLMWNDPTQAPVSIIGPNNFPTVTPMNFSLLGPPLRNNFSTVAPFGNLNQYTSHVYVVSRGNLFVNEIGNPYPTIDPFSGIADGLKSPDPAAFNVAYGSQRATGLYPLSFTLAGANYVSPGASYWITLIGDDLWSLTDYSAGGTRKMVLMKAAITIGVPGPETIRWGYIARTLNWHRNLLYGRNSGRSAFGAFGKG